MNKLMKVLAASALVATTLVGCSSGSSAKIAKAGLGVVTSDVAKDYAGNYQVNTTFAVVGLDGDGKIVDIAVDVAQSSPAAEGAKTTTKKDLKEKYDMKKASGIGKEWYEQIAAFEEYCKGKTADEVASIETEVKDEEHNAVPKAGSDLAAGCTMNIGDFKEAVKKACDNAVEVAADSVSVGYVMNVGKDYAGNGQLNTTIAMIAKDADGKIAAADLDVAQISAAEGADTRTKTEKKEDYDMKKASGIGKEWYEQMAAFENAVKGMTADDVAKIETEKKDDEHPSVPKTGTDLAAGCTMNIADFQTAIANAMK